jgi:hypothetical protein
MGLDGELGGSGRRGETVDKGGQPPPLCPASTSTGIAVGARRQFVCRKLPPTSADCGIIAVMVEYLITVPISIVVGMIANALTPTTFSRLSKLYRKRMPAIIMARIDLARRLSAGPPGKAVGYLARFVIVALALCILAAIFLVASIILDVNGEPSNVALIVSMVLFAAATVVIGWTMRLCKRIYDFDNFLSRAQAELAKLGAPASPQAVSTEDPPGKEAVT